MPSFLYVGTLKVKTCLHRGHLRPLLPGVRYRKGHTHFPTTAEFISGPQMPAPAASTRCGPRPAGAILTHFPGLPRRKIRPSLHQQIDDFVGLALGFQILKFVGGADGCNAENLRKHSVSLAEVTAVKSWHRRRHPAHRAPSLGSNAPSLINLSFPNGGRLRRALDEPPGRARNKNRHKKK